MNVNFNVRSITNVFSAENIRSAPQNLRAAVALLPRNAKITAIAVAILCVVVAVVCIVRRFIAAKRQPLADKTLTPLLPLLPEAPGTATSLAPVTTPGTTTSTMTSSAGDAPSSSEKIGTDDDTREERSSVASDDESSFAGWDDELVVKEGVEDATAQFRSTGMHFASTPTEALINRIRSIKHNGGHCTLKLDKKVHPRKSLFSISQNGPIQDPNNSRQQLYLLLGDPEDLQGEKMPVNKSLLRALIQAGSDVINVEEKIHELLSDSSEDDDSEERVCTVFERPSPPDSFADAGGPLASVSPDEATNSEHGFGEETVSS